MIYVVATIHLRAGTRPQFLEIFSENVPRVLAEDGCLQYGPAIDLATGIAAQVPLRPDVVTVIERWRDLAALQAHLQAPHMLAYREKVKDMVEKASLQVLEPVPAQDLT